MMAATLCWSGCARQSQSAPERRATVDFAETSFLEVVADGQAAIFAGTIRKVESGEPDAEGVRAGTLDLAVTHELTPQRRKVVGGTLALHFAQIADPLMRIRAGQGGWNDVEIEPGRSLLFALSPIPASRPAPPSIEAVLAVLPLDSTQDPRIESAKEMLHIESETDPSRRLDLLKKALESKRELLLDYCHFAVGRMKRVPRADAVPLEIAVLADPARPPKERSAALATLELQLWDAATPTDPLNRAIVRAFIGALEAREVSLRRRLVQAVYNMLVSDAPKDSQDALRYRRDMLGPDRLPVSDAALAEVQALASDSDLSAEARWLSEFLASHR
jgi:hypothetical protein